MPEPLFLALDVLLRHSYSFLWADYVELLCFCSRNGMVAKGNLQVVQKVTFLGNTDNVNFGWFAYDLTNGHPKKCYPILNHAL